MANESLHPGDVNSPELIEQALGRTKAWLGEWYSEFQKTTGLTPANLRSRTSPLSIVEYSPIIIVRTDEWTGQYLILERQRRLQSLLGNVSAVRMVQAFPGSAPEGAPEDVMAMASPNDFEKVNGMAKGWRRGESDIAFMSMGFSENGSASITQLTGPGLLFPSHNRHFQDYQMFTFNVNHRGGKTAWRATLGIENERDVLMSVSSNGKVLKSQRNTNCILPDSIDIPKALDNIVTLKPATAA